MLVIVIRLTLFHASDSNEVRFCYQTCYKKVNDIIFRFVLILYYFIIDIITIEEHLSFNIFSQTCGCPRHFDCWTQTTVALIPLWFLLHFFYLHMVLTFNYRPMNKKVGQYHSYSCWKILLRIESNQHIEIFDSACSLHFVVIFDIITMVTCPVNQWLMTADPPNCKQ